MWGGHQVHAQRCSRAQRAKTGPYANTACHSYSLQFIPGGHLRILGPNSVGTILLEANICPLLRTMSRNIYPKYIPSQSRIFQTPKIKDSTNEVSDFRIF